MSLEDIPVVILLQATVSSKILLLLFAVEEERSP